MSTRRTLLFTTPYLALNGAEIALVNFLNLFADDGHRIVLISGYEGEVTSRLDDRIIVVPINEELQKLEWKVKRKLGNGDQFKEVVLRTHRKYQPEKWFINTCVQPRFLEIAAELQVDVILYSHELDARLQQLPKEDLGLIASYPKQHVASSEKAKEALAGIGVPDAQVLFPGLDLMALVPIDQRDEVRRNHGITANDTWVVTVGNIDENKNPKLFLEVARALPDMKFIWIGGKLDSELGAECVEASNAPGLRDRVNFGGWMKEDYHEVLSSCDIVLGTSTQESFGLSLLEAVWLGRKVVTTPCGGPQTWMNADMGVIAATHSVEDLVAAIGSAKAPSIGKAQLMQYDVSSCYTTFKNALER